MTAVRTGYITLTSNPHKKRAGLVPLCAFLAMGWALAIMYTVVAVLNWSENAMFSLALIVSMLGFGLVLSLFGMGLLRDSYRDYILELTDTEAVLVVIDRLRKKKGTQMVLLDDISYAEYYPYSDQASIILHTSYIDMEIPLWPMSNQGRDVVDYLSGRGVMVVNVQSDDPIPDSR
ncbi:MAG: hypothetical protein JST01_04640 [Cyanobacteria bacterium SZAS TMP-1]|nr:hypothetical protein [Cyanobacteria bacterium SZAS TMP-1]